MSDCRPLKLAENGQSTSSQSSGGESSRGSQNNTRRISRGLPDERGDLRFEAGDQYHHHQQNHHQHDSGFNRNRSQSESSTKSGQLRYGAKNVIELFIPVSICMLLVVGIMKATDSYHYSSQSVIWYAQMMYTDQTVDTGTRVWQSLANALIMLVMIVVMTTVLILLYKFRCYTTIHAWLIISSLMLLFIFATVHLTELLKVYNMALDIFTLGIFLWNFGVVGMVCIHWKGPLLLQQGYLITISAFMALIFIQCLPDWTIWSVLAIVSIWDLIAVLAPRGPLRILVETAQERNESIFPALIYSSTIMWEVLGTTVVSTIPSISMAEVKSGSNTSKRNKKSSTSSTGASSSRHSNHRTSNSGTPQKRDQNPVEINYDDGIVQPPQVAFIQPRNGNNLNETSEDWQRPPIRAINSMNSRARNENLARNGGDLGAVREHSIDLHDHHDEGLRNDQQQMEEERGVKLGLGDFIFYSVLVGKASSYGDWTITMSCYVAILVGLSVTLSLLALFRKALPALPISIAFGMCSFFLSSVFVVPFAERLAINQVFI